MECFNHTCRGESHVISGKVCQDFSLSKSEDGMTVAIVCDGHGGDKYFRSQKGSRFAAEITQEALFEFLKETDSALFKGIGQGGPGEYEGEAGTALRQLFGSIIIKWRDRINADAMTEEVNEWEKANVPQEALDNFANKEHLESIYGCTLIAFASCRDYWLAFHIGDGKCLEITPEEPTFWKMPVPWDDECFLNVTTSLSSSNAIDKFRYCYRGDGRFPAAIFLGTDGIDDCMGEDENLANFYFRLSKEIINNEEGLGEALAECLEGLSKKGNKDDCSIACAYDRKSLYEVLPKIINHQLNTTESEITRLEREIIDIESKIAELARLKTELEALNSKKAIFEKEMEKFK